MKDIPLKRILRLYLAAFIVLFFVANVLSNEASATVQYSESFLFSGNNIFSNIPGIVGSTQVPFVGQGAINYSFVDFDDGKNIHRIITNSSGTVSGFNSGIPIALDASAAGINARFNEFNAYVDNVYYGTGVIGWERLAGNEFNYIIEFISINETYANSLTGKKRVDYVYNMSVFTSYVNAPCGGCGYSTIATTVTYNYVYVTIGTSDSNVGTYNWETFIEFLFTDTATVTAENVTTSTFSWINLTKSGVNYQFNITNASESSFYDVTSINDVSIMLNYSSGINFALRHVGLDVWANRTIYNASGGLFVAPSPPPAPTPDPTTGVGIIFDASSYLIGATANISWIRTSSTPFGYQDDIYLTQPGSIKKILASSPADSGYVKTNDLPVSGTYNVSFERSLFGFGFSPEILATDNATVTAEQASYIIVNATVPVGVYTDGTYLYGWDGTGRIVIYQDLPDGTVKEIDSLPINATCCVEHTVSQLFFPESGNYRVVLMKGYSEVKAVASVVAYLSDIVPGANITVSNISIDKSQYTYGEPYTITYQVDSFNYSTKAKRIIAYEVATGANTLVNPIPAQTGSITRTFDSEMFPFSGALQFRLIGLNATGDYLLASVNFTLSKIDTEGYGLDVTKSPICIKETGYFTYYSPSPVTVSISDRDVTVYSKNLTSAVSGKTVPFTINRAGNYEIFLRPSNETDVKFTKIIEVKACDVAAQSPVSGAGQAKQVAAMITTPIFWALLVTAGLMIAIAWKTRDGFAAGSVGMLSAGVFAFMSWLPLWIFFSVLIIAALLLSSSLVAKQLKKTG